MLTDMSWRRQPRGTPESQQTPHARAAFAAILTAGLMGLVCAPLAAQEVPAPNRGGFTESMGIPPTWRWSLGFSARTHREAGEEANVALYGSGGFYRDLMNPMTAALGVMGEG